MDRATTVAMSMLSNFDDDPDLSNFLFYAGGLLKAQGLHDKARYLIFLSDIK